MLADQERNVDEAVAIMGGSAVTLRQHLAILAKYGLVARRRRNRKIVYGITSRGRKALEVLGAAEHLESGALI
jgi:DNA-binding transcriptional ArsR family regulator